MANKIHTIEFGPKFCQAQLDTVFRDEVYPGDDQVNGSASIVNHWEESFSNEVSEVIFDLTISEWISTEEVVFLFAWIRRVILKGKKIKIRLPFSYNIEKIERNGQKIYSEKKLKYLKSKYGFEESEKSIKKRYLRNIFLMVNWGLRNNTGLSDFDFENRLDGTIYNKRYDSIDDTFNKVVPFTALDTSFDGSVTKYDLHFQEVLKGNKSLTGVRTPFELEKQIENILREFACYSPFESKILSNVIFQELYLNTCQHSYELKEVHKECYMAASFSRIFQSKDSKKFKERFISEKDNEAIDFFKDKKEIIPDLKADSKRYKKPKKIERRIAKLDKYDIIKKQSYIEYTFIDFGKGFTSTLKEEYENNKSNVKHLLSQDHDNAAEDSRIIEYALLLETSCIPLDKNIENYDQIPRGLYFLVDMVRRYKGMIKIRSGKGKVFYDFSDKIYIELKEGKQDAEVFQFRPYNVKEAVVHCRSDEIEKFDGVMISVLLPEKNIEFPKNESATSISPVRLESDVLNGYVYYREKEKFPSQNFDPQSLFPQSYEHIGMLFLFNDVIEKYINEETTTEDILHSSKTTKQLNQLFYNRLYARLVDELKKYSDKNCVIFIDFAEVHFNTQFSKIIYYLLNTPRINELTKVVLVNIDPNIEIILDVFKELLLDESYAPFIFKPIPYMNFRNLYFNNDVKWIGLRDKGDEKILTKILFDEKSTAEINLLSKKNVEGNILYEHEGWVYSFLKPIQK